MLRLRFFDSMFARLFIVFGSCILVVQTVSWQITTHVFHLALLRPSAYNMSLPAFVLLAALVQLTPPLVAAGLAARYLSRPFRTLARGAADIARNIDAPPLAEVGPSEARSAARLCNQMQAAIRQQLNERGRFLAAVSHDMRTPLTRMKLRLGAAQRSALHDQLLDDVEEMTILVDATLSFLRNEEVVETYGKLDINALVRAVAEDAIERGERVEVEGAVSGVVYAQPLAMKRCLTNLVSNAVRYGEQAQITVRDSGSGVEIRVADRGPGIPEEEIERVFAPFYRLDASRSKATGGTGLGLAIAQDVAIRHRGSLRLENRVEGGLVAVLRIPRA
ncbi:ATP-binding protein [Paraburkholderia unamae]|uniref:histidine kinase n=1 Tax=Paraburkholderia unamae TaxID=219649 RepID=A0ABX5KA32_9BURK|nr:ATP-binding protein [Paraburkholderia unamae]PVX61047.1 protein-histidine pros-kinase [Paraburkholderia unamae]CAG9266315.1 Histidine kinase [Paraburkholderia unamae]